MPHPECLQQVAQCRLDDLKELLGLWPIKDKTKSKGGCLAQTPVLWGGVLADIGLNERHDLQHHRSRKEARGFKAVSKGF